MSSPIIAKALFSLGRLLATPGALEKLTHHDTIAALGRHTRGDWGDLEAEDKQANDDALKNGTRLFSAFTAENGTRFWIITEADRASTTILLPSEY